AASLNSSRTPESGDALGRLGLGPADRAALARQGFVAAEWRRRGGRRWGPYFKLRWRRGGVQRVRYLRRESDRAREVEACLGRLRRSAWLARVGRALLADARHRLRALKEQLEPLLAARGKRLHGYAARRRPPAGPPAHTNSPT